jgi:hypothetical protein
VIYIEPAQSGNSTCVKCGNSIKRFDLRLRLKLTWRHGFMLCSECVDEILKEWEETKKKW